MGVAWSHCPLCELKQVAWFPSTATTLCWGTRPPPTCTATCSLSSAPGTLPQRPSLPTPPIPAQICTLQGILGVRGEGRGRGGAAVLCILTPMQPHSAPW